MTLWGGGVKHNVKMMLFSAKIVWTSHLTRAGKMKSRILVWSLSGKLDGKGYTKYRNFIWVGDKKMLFGFEIMPLFGYEIRKILFGFEENKIFILV